jgi:uncharacterized delta-60 repeat protein
MDSTTLPPTDGVPFSRYRKIVASIFIPTAVAVFCACAPSMEKDSVTVTNVGVTKATLGGAVRSSNGFDERGVVYSLAKVNDDPEVGGEGVTKVSTPGTEDGAFTVNVTGLLPGREYAFKAYASSEKGAGHTNTGFFTTLALEVISPTSADLTDTSATLGGEVLSDVGGSITERGVVYAPTTTNDDPIIGGSGVTKAPAAGVGTGVFTVGVTGLTPGVEYTYKAYASIGDDTVYSESDYFPEDTGGTSIGVDGAFVEAVAALPDGGAVVGGRFNNIDGVALKNLARLDADGNVDPTFTPLVAYGTFDARVNAIAVQKDGKIIIGGVFYQINGHFAGPSIARLNADGTHDETFDASTDYGTVQCLAIQPDGKILVGGAFASGGLNGDTRYRYIGRLNANGTLDTTFIPSPNTGPNSFVESIAVQDDGMILLAGSFWEYNGVAQARFARVNSIGALDTNFTPDFDAYDLALQADGKILISSYDPAGGGSTYGLHRADKITGDLDPTFATSTGNTGGAFTDEKITSIAVQADGKILIAGGFTEVDGTPRAGAARINTDGTLDASFDPYFGYKALGVALQDDGKVQIVGGLEPAPYVPGVFEDLIEVGANDPATGSLGATSASRVQWLRGGSAPEVSQVEFQMSTNAGTTWTLLGVGTRIAGGWELTGLSLPVGAEFRARGRVTSGKLNGSSGLVEESTIAGGGGPTGTLPTLTSATSAAVTSNSATLGGNVTNQGDPNITERGVVFSRSLDSEEPRLEDVDDDEVRAVAASSLGDGVFTVPVSGLVVGTYYSFRAYATNVAGTSYTTVGEFKTHGPPRIEGPGVIPSSTSALLSGDLKNDGGSPITERGVIYSPRTANANRLLTKQNGGIKVVDNDISLGYTDVSVTGLTPATEYQFVAYASNALGTSYTTPKLFTTNGAAPSEPEEELPVEGVSGGPLSGSPSGPEEAAGDPSGTFDSEVEAGGLVQALAMQADGKTIIAGDFLTGAPEIRVDLARLNEDGSVDSIFKTITNGLVYSVAVQPDGKILLGGLFTSVNGNTRNGIVRLEADGSVENPSSFSPGAGADNVVYAVALQPDGKILLGGLFENIQGTPRKGIARLLADGSLDTDFDPGAGFDDAVYSLAVQADGAIVVGGVFEDIDGTARNRIARLEADGDHDTTFNPGSGADERVTSVAVQPDGKILLGGWFSSYNGTPRNRIVRILATGAIDTTFDPGSGANDHIYSMALQTDGKILVGGLFQTINGTARNRIARLNVGGSVDTTFNPGTGADGEVNAVALKEDGSILLGGLFQFVDGLARNGVARLENDAATQSLTVVNGTQLTWLRGGAGPEVLPVNFEISTNAGTTWTGLGAGTRVAGGWSITGQDLPVNGLVRALGRTSGGFLGGSAGIVEESISYNHQARIAALQAQLAAANANVAKLQKQIKAAKKKKNAAKAKKLTKSLKTATAQVAKAKADLAKY